MAKRDELIITNEDMGFLIRKHSVKFRGAFLSETMGPHWKPITWVIRGGSKYPYVASTTHTQMKRLLTP